MIRIILVDDHRLFRDGLRRLLSTDARLEIVGEAGSGEDFLELLDSLGNDVDLVFMDIDMPGMGGIEATRRAIKRLPKLKIVALSMHNEEEFYAPMLAAGAADFLMKDSTLEQVLAAIFGRDIDGGSSYATPPSTEPLTDREQEVLPLICAGLSTGQIAEKLFISKRTVDKHRANILDKTGCRNTASLVVHAVKNGLISI